ncbi:glycosyltransferase family 2 protein [Pseudomonas putida]
MTTHASSAPVSFPTPPLVSIVSPCYNGEKYLLEALRSIAALRYPNTEWIIVDDGSTDNSYAMLEDLQSTYGYQLYRQANQGVSAALNHGMQYARGEYVCTPDLDDIMLPDSICQRLEYLQQHPQVGVVGALVEYIDDQSQTIKCQSRATLQRFTFEQLLADARVCGAPTALYRMAALREANFYDPAIKVQDFQITLRVASLGYEVHSVPILVTRYRRHGGNLSRRYRKMLAADLLAIAPYQQHPAYAAGHAQVIGKALKYAVVEDKRDACRLLWSVPFRQWDGNIAKRLKRLVFSW